MKKNVVIQNPGKKNWVIQNPESWLPSQNPESWDNPESRIWGNPESGISVGILDCQNPRTEVGPPPAIKFRDDSDRIPRHSDHPFRSDPTAFRSDFDNIPIRFQSQSYPRQLSFKSVLGCVPYRSQFNSDCTDKFECINNYQY